MKSDINNSSHNKSLSLKVLKVYIDAQKAFIDAPTNENLESMIRSANQYNEAWINDATNARPKASFVDFISVLGPKIAAPSSSNRSNIHNELIGRVEEALSRLLEPKTSNRHPDPRPLSEIRVMNKVINSWTTVVNRAKNQRSVQQSRIDSSIAKSDVSLITSLTYVPYEVLDILNKKYLDSRYHIDLQQINSVKMISKEGLSTPLNFHSLKIASSRLAARGFAPSEDIYQRKIRTNRRWYIEQSKLLDIEDNSLATPWMEERQKVENLFDYKILTNKKYDDSRIHNVSFFDSSANLIETTHLAKTQKIQHISAFTKYDLDIDLQSLAGYKLPLEILLDEICLFSEEENLKKFPGLKFAIFESSYYKTPRQFLKKNDSIAPIWRDVLLYNNDFITFRSFTNDLNHSPKAKEVHMDIKDDPWYLSNDMPEMSNQAFRFFKDVLDADVVSRIQKFKKEKISNQEITKLLELDTDKWQRIWDRRNDLAIKTSG